MTRKRKLLLGVSGGLSLVIATLLLYLTFSDLSNWRDTVARLASKGMDRELTIAGEFEVDFGIVTRVRATKLSLANTGWGSEPSMAAVNRLEAEINLWELFSGSIHLPNVDIEGGRAIFESDAEAGSNWALGPTVGSSDNLDDSGPVRLRIDRIRGSDVTLIFGSTTDEDHVDLVIDTLDSTGDPEGMHQLTGDGTLRGTAYTLSGGFGSFEELINLEPFDHDLQATLGSTGIRSTGSVGRIADLGDLDLKAEATIPNPTEIYRFLGLSYEFSRPLTIQADATTASGLTAFTLTTTGQAADLTAIGNIDSLISPEDLDVKIEFAGPDIRPIAALAGITDLDEKPFDIEGRLTWRGFPIVVSGLEIRVGENWVTADGDLGKPPLMLQTDFRFEGAGPNAAEVASLAGLQLPPDMYEIDCHILRVEGGLSIEEVRAKIGPTLLTTTGFIGDPPEYAKTDLDFDIRGPDLSRFDRLIGIDAPTEPFRVKGRLAQGDQAIDLHGVQAVIGSATLTADGRLKTDPGLTGTDLTFTTDGLDLLHIGNLLGFDGLPASPVRAQGRVSVTGEGFRLHNVTGRIADINVSAQGFITNHKHLVGTRLEITTDGVDLSILDNLVPSLTLPAKPFRVSGGFELQENGIGLHTVEFELEEAGGSVDGIVGIPWRLEPTDLQIDARGPSLAVFDSLVASVSLPAEQFSASGGLSVHDDLIDFRDTTVVIAGNTARIAGTLATKDGLIGSSLEASVESPDSSALGTLIEEAVAIEIPTLPEKPISVAGNVVIDENGTHLPSLSVTLGQASATLAGDMGSWPDLIGADLTVHAAGPDASLLATLTHADVPVAPFRMDGRVRRFDTGHTFDQLTASLGDYRVEIDGTLGKLPKLIGTDLDFHIEGPDLTLVRDLTEIAALPPGSFGLTGHFEGNPRLFQANALKVRLGSSDIEGDLHIDLKGKPSLSGKLQSNRVDVADFFPRAAPTGTETELDPAQPDIAEAKLPLVVSDNPWDLAFLNTIDLDLDWEIANGEYLLDDGRDIFISVVLEDGQVRVDRFEATGKLGGKARGNASLVPVAEGHRLKTEFHIDQGMINLAGQEADPSEYTPVDFHVDLGAAGRTAHEMAASANGRVSLNIAGGTLKKGILDVVSADVLVTLLSALNPFAKNETTTNLNCAVLVATFEDGLMTLDPAAVQTDKVTILGDGTIDFKTEKLRLDWITKPRKGIGISASMFTNPYIRLGGTLADPDIEMKPVEALATTGVAVVTMGISLVAKGFLDRITAEKKVCEKAMKQVAEMDAEAGTPDS